MAWMWWLLAPLVMTVLGASGMWWFARREMRATGWSGTDAILAYRALLDALPQGRPEDSTPVNIVVLPTTPDQADTTRGHKQG